MDADREVTELGSPGIAVGTRRCLPWRASRGRPVVPRRPSPRTSSCLDALDPAWRPPGLPTQLQARLPPPRNTSCWDAPKAQWRCPRLNRLAFRGASCAVGPPCHSPRGGRASFQVLERRAWDREDVASEEKKGSVLRVPCWTGFLFHFVVTEREGTAKNDQFIHNDGLSLPPGCLPDGSDARAPALTGHDHLTLPPHGCGEPPPGTR